MFEARLFLTALMEHKVAGFQRIMTGDVACFFFYCARDSVWAASRNELPQRTRQKTETEKVLDSILWSVDGIHSFVDVPKGTTYNTGLFTDVVILSLIENVRSRTDRKRLKGWLIHMGNARPQHCDELKDVSRPQELTACRIRLTTQT
jgi:hypothetical protein